MTEPAVLALSGPKESRSPATAWVKDGRVLAILSAAGFSMKAIFVKLAYAAYPVDPVTLLTLRMVIALPAFLWLSRGALGQLGASPRAWAGLIGLGLVGYYLSSLFDFIGLQSISAGLERLILFTYPTMVVLLEAAWRRKAVSRRMMAGMGITYIGIAIAFHHDLHARGDTAAVLLGGFWVFLSSLTYSSYYMGSAMLVGRVGAERMAGVAGAVATLFIVVQFALTRSIADLAVLPPGVWLWSAAMALISTALPIWLAAKAVAGMGAGRTAAISSMGPALTIVLGWMILSEPASVAQVVGVAFVLGGVWWIGRAKS